MATEDVLNTNALVRDWIDENTDGCAGQSGESEEGFASIFYESCMKLFQQLYKESCRTSSLSQQEQHRLKEDLGRLFLWGDGFGDRMLDQILGQSLELRNTVLGFISGIGKVLTGKVLAIASKPQQGGTFSDQVDDLNILIEKAESIIDEASHTKDNDSDTDSHSDASLCSKSDGLADISSYILCLMDLVPTMERTLSHILLESQTERILPILPMLSLQVSGPARTYAQNIFDKFPSADIKLIERLGEVNWQRHMSIRRRMKQAASHIKAVRVARDSGVGGCLASRSTHSTSAASDVTFESGNADCQGGQRIVLSIPYPFHCKICGEMLATNTDDNALALHILADLEPYSCTFSSCKDELVTFPTRKLWVDHEFSEHRGKKVWQCVKCADIFDEVQLWGEHLESRHRIFFSAPLFHIAAASAEGKIPRQLRHTQCPLCLMSLAPAQSTFAIHLGNHMKDIALTALSPEIDTDTESEANSLEEDTHDAWPEGGTEGITDQLGLASDPDTVSTVRSDQHGGDVLGTESCTEEYPFNVAVPGAHVSCSVFFLETRKHSGTYKKLPVPAILKSSAAMFSCMEHYSRFLNVQVLKIKLRCDAITQTCLLKRNDTEEYELFVRTSNKMVQDQSRGRKENKIMIEFWIEPNEDQKVPNSLPGPQPGLSWNLVTPATEPLVTHSREIEPPGSVAELPKSTPYHDIPEEYPNVLPGGGGWELTQPLPELPKLGPDCGVPEEGFDFYD